jgi:hypothetical protein
MTHVKTNRIRFIPIEGTYRGERTTALLDVENNSVKITSGPLNGWKFSSPSAAACALIVPPTINGWTFWKAQPVVISDFRTL